MNGKERIALVSLGCPKNTVDSERVAGLADAGGYRLVKDLDEADIAIINTCGFLQASAQESIDRILEIGELKKEGRIKKLLVMGCLVGRYGDDLIPELPEVDGFFKVGAFRELAEYLKIGSAEKTASRCLSTPSHYAYIKIAEGCNMKCTFCTIPRIRGVHESRTYGDIEEECRMLADRGVKEVILVSQDTMWYGRDLHEKNALVNLVRRIGKISGIHWIRIMYLHPGHFTTKLIGMFSEEEKVCKYVDIPVQHISDPILKAMKRAGSKRIIYRLIERLRSDIPGIALRTTLLTGFPGETKEHFGELLQFVRDVEFDRLGVFGFSPEDGTPAARMKPFVGRREINRRVREIMEVQAQIAKRKNIAALGRVMPVLIDSYDSQTGWSVGRSEFDAPEIDQRVLFSRRIEAGTLVEAHIIGAAEHDLLAA